MIKYAEEASAISRQEMSHLQRRKQRCEKNYIEIWSIPDKNSILILILEISNFVNFNIPDIIICNIW